MNAFRPQIKPPEKRRRCAHGVRLLTCGPFNRQASLWTEAGNDAKEIIPCPQTVADTPLDAFARLAPHAKAGSRRLSGATYATAAAPIKPHDSLPNPETKIMTVSFMVGGAQKCGTTALYTYLKQHPRIEMSRDKETHFFNREEGMDWRRPDYAALERQFSTEAAHDTLKGEATPATLYWTPAHGRIFNYNPGMKFIFLFRPPAERALSHWRMIHARGWEPLSFSDAIRIGRLRVLDDFKSPMGLNRFYSYVERGYYGRQVRQILSLFPRSQIIFLRQKDLISSPQTVLDDVSEFLGIEKFADVERITVHKSSDSNLFEIGHEDKKYLENLYENDQELFLKITGVSFE